MGGQTEKFCKRLIWKSLKAERFPLDSIQSEKPIKVLERWIDVIRTPFSEGLVLEEERERGRYTVWRLLL